MAKQDSAKVMANNYDALRQIPSVGSGMSKSVFDSSMTKEQIANVLSKMSKAELKEYARSEGIRLFTTVPDKMRVFMCNKIYLRLHHGDAFWSSVSDEPNRTNFDSTKKSEHKWCHIDKLISALFKRDPGFVIGVYKGFEMDDHTRMAEGMEASVNYKRLLKICERMQRHGVIVYGHLTPTGRFVLDVHDIWVATCTTLANAYVEGHE